MCYHKEGERHMKNQFINQLSDTELDELCKLFKLHNLFNIPINTYGFRQGKTKLDMKDGSISIFSYYFDYMFLTYLNDFEIKTSKKNKLPNELPVDIKRTEILFVYMIEKFDNYFEEAKEYLKENPYLLKILNRAFRKVQNIKTKNIQDNNVELQ